MKLGRLMILFSLLGYSFDGFAIAAEQPYVAVQKLYREVVARRPLGIPKNADKAAIWPFLSHSLTQRLEAAQACEADYLRHHSDDGKPEYAWLEFGLFSGSNEEAIPASATVQRTEPQPDGSFRVYVRLTYKESFETHGQSPNPVNSFRWQVAAVVIKEKGRFVVDDILFFKEHTSKLQSRLSQILTQGCEGRRWVGNRA